LAFAPIRFRLRAATEILPLANRVIRTPVLASNLIVGLRCGGSDGYSGITANPALGAAVDLLVGHGGTAILSEAPEIYGAEHLLTRRAVTPEVGEKILKRFRWWIDYCARHGIGFIPFYPLKIGDLAESEEVKSLAAREQVTPALIGLAWLFHRSPVMIPIPGTSSVEHLEENIAAAAITLSRSDFELLAAA